MSDVELEAEFGQFADEAQERATLCAGLLEEGKP